ncbi:MAG: bifunctional salicylyl-CoA 5-hydroxylase/oxidoreductase [Acidobacteriota bacterium]|nr:bifunctional salicylyl-CoA 5-hydroxylase/oxidoreductase [Acidobacteriota bacterium]
MKIEIVGGGPGGLYFALLMKKRDPGHRVRVHERNRADDTFGFGVVFSDATMDNLADADRESYDAITRAFYHWDDIDIHYRGTVLSSTGHGFAGLSRQTLLDILAQRCRELGVEIDYESEVDPEAAGFLADADLVVAADGVNSRFRETFAEHFQPAIDWRPNRFVWLGTTQPFPAFTFYFQEDRHGLWRAHAYQYEPTENGEARSTFIVETTDETFHAAGLDPEDEDATVAFCQQLFAEQLDGHGLIKNRSLWRRFPTIKNGHWHHGKMVLLGDAAHTAHFSVGSGTKLALEDSIALADTLQDLAEDETSGADLNAALQRYEEERRPDVESLQRAAQASLQWFEETERYFQLPPVQFGFTLLTRSLRISHEDLKLRDPAYVRNIDRWFAEEAQERSGERILPEPAPTKPAPTEPVPPPLFTPFKLRGLLLPNRVVVSAMCQYSAEDGRPNDWHLVHLGSRAVGGAGLVITEMTDISREARITPGCAGLYQDEHVTAWRRITDFVHENTTSKIGVQLAHAGRKGATKLAWEGIDEPLEEGAWPLLAASPIPYLEHSQVPKAMDHGDMDAVRDDFVAAARRADEAGFDLLELHCAHGYLLATFLSPLTNQRQDEYGGSLENRMRYPLEVFDAVRAVWPEDKPIFVRISAVDWAPGGNQPEDAVEIARLLKAHDCDLVDVSAGQTVPDAKPVYGRLFQTPFSDRVRHEVGIPTMAVGNISSYTDVNTILAAGRADLCALARMHLWDPYWTRHAAHALGWDLPWPDPYSVLDRFTPRFE